MSFRGLTWDHPRGRFALERAQGPVTWDAQPLEGFESASIAANAAAYDLVVLDHPHLGEALAADCLRPLDEVFDPAQLAAIRGRSIGRCFESYLMDGWLWALPLDAATQVMALRPDLLRERPQTWQDVLTLARGGTSIALSLAGPHAALSFMSVAQALQPDLDMRNGDAWVPVNIAEQAIAILAELTAGTPATTYDLNPIGLLDYMSNHDDVALCPLVYGYVNYAAQDRAHPLAFHDAPRIGDGPPGTILGGTGIAISRGCNVTDALRDHLIWLLSADVQAGFIPQNAGQPSARAAWASDGVNAPVNEFYQQTAASLEAAAIRPRHDGYIAFQTQASALLRAGFAANLPIPQLTRDLSEMFGRSHQTPLMEACR